MITMICEQREDRNKKKRGDGEAVVKEAEMLQQLVIRELLPFLRTPVDAA